MTISSTAPSRSKYQRMFRNDSLNHTPPSSNSSDVNTNRETQTLDEAIVNEIEDLLTEFVGIDTIRDLFWSVLSYHHEDLAMSTNLLPDSIRDDITTFKLFATHQELKVYMVQANEVLTYQQIQTLSNHLKSRATSHILILHDSPISGWKIVRSPVATQLRPRILDLSDRTTDITSKARGLAALAVATSTASETDIPVYQIEDEAQQYFPGGQLAPAWEFQQKLTKEQEQNPWYQWIEDSRFITELTGKQITLTHQQEKGLDLRGDEVPTDGSSMPYQQWRLVQSQLRLVVHLCKRYYKRARKFNLSIDDLIQEGILGLIHAAHKYDPDRGTRFSTYSYYWIIQKIRRYFDQFGRTIRIPVHISEARRNGVNTSPLRFSEKQILSLDTDDYWTDKSFTSDMDQVVSDVHERFTNAEVLRQINSLMPRDALILKLRFGMEGYTEHTLEEVGTKLGVTRERIRQIQVRATKHLRNRLPKWIKNDE